jgi:hypothetical protein
MLQEFTSLALTVPKKVLGVTVVLENTAGGGSTIGRSFEELRKILDQVGTDFIANRLVAYTDRPSGRGQISCRDLP